MRRNSLRVRAFIFDRRGSIAIQFGLLAVPMIAFVGLAIDYSRAVAAREALKQVVDAAAIAGARLPATTSEQRYNAASKMLNASLATARLTGASADIQATNARVVVTANYTLKTGFMGILGTTELTVAAKSSAQSQVENGGVACMISLNETTDNGLHLQGINKVSSRNCWTWVNSDSPTGINATGASMGTGQGFCSHGGATGTDHFDPQPYDKCERIADPFKAKFSSYSPYNAFSSCNFNNKQFNNTHGSIEYMDPGVYCGNTVLKPQAIVEMRPGTYIFRDGYLEVQAQSSLTGSGVSLFFVGNNTSLQVRGGGSIDLKAPATGDLAGFVIVDRLWPGYNSIRESEIQGGGRVKLEGVVYAPQWKLNIGGNGELNEESDYLAIVADSFYMEGNGKLFVTSNATKADLPDLMPRIKTGPMLLE